MSRVQGIISISLVVPSRVAFIEAMHFHEMQASFLAYAG